MRAAMREMQARRGLLSSTWLQRKIEGRAAVRRSEEVGQTCHCGGLCDHAESEGSIHP